MKDSKSSIFIAVGLVLLGLTLGFCIKAGFQVIANNSRTVDVRGLSEREVMANNVVWPVVYKITANDAQDLYSRIEANNKTIREYLTKNGLNEKDFSPLAPSIDDKNTDRYLENKGGDRYIATAGIVVNTSKVETVNKLIENQTELLKQGVAIIIGEYNYSTKYSFTSLNDIKPEMIADATKKAREAAEKFATDSGSKVGRLMQAAQGQFSIEDRDSYTPYIKQVRVVTSMTYAIDD
ncbi:MAG: SIMPL domain-containing protein [Muribaculaceae bacterium]|nr:SIMPL domain-containing protein [Muribaculaceae bacterium]